MGRLFTNLHVCQHLQSAACGLKYCRNEGLVKQTGFFFVVYYMSSYPSHLKKEKKNHKTQYCQVKLVNATRNMVMLILQLRMYVVSVIFGPESE